MCKIPECNGTQWWPAIANMIFHVFIYDNRRLNAVLIELFNLTPRRENTSALQVVLHNPFSQCDYIASQCTVRFTRNACIPPIYLLCLFSFPPKVFTCRLLLLQVNIMLFRWIFSCLNMAHSLKICVSFGAHKQLETLARRSFFSNIFTQIRWCYVEHFSAQSKWSLWINRSDRYLQKLLQLFVKLIFILSQNRIQFCIIDNLQSGTWFNTDTAAIVQRSAWCVHCTWRWPYARCRRMSASIQR